MHNIPFCRSYVNIARLCATVAAHALQNLQSNEENADELSGAVLNGDSGLVEVGVEAMEVDDEIEVQGMDLEGEEEDMAEDELEVIFVLKFLFLNFYIATNEHRSNLFWRSSLFIKVEKVVRELRT